MTHVQDFLRSIIIDNRRIFSFINNSNRKSSKDCSVTDGTQTKCLNRNKKRLIKCLQQGEGSGNPSANRFRTTTSQPPSVVQFTSSSSVPFIFFHLLLEAVWTMPMAERKSTGDQGWHVVHSRRNRRCNHTNGPSFEQSTTRPWITVTPVTFLDPLHLSASDLRQRDGSHQRSPDLGAGNRLRGD